MKQILLIIYISVLVAYMYTAVLHGMKSIDCILPKGPNSLTMVNQKVDLPISDYTYTYFDNLDL